MDIKAFVQKYKLPLIIVLAILSAIAARYGVDVGGELDKATAGVEKIERAAETLDTLAATESTP